MQPYLHSVEIDKDKLPSPSEVMKWNQDQLVNALRHESKSKLLDTNFRQLLHISFKIAAEKGKRYYDAMEGAKDIISNCVTNNLFERHIKHIFI